MRAVASAGGAAHRDARVAAASPSARGLAALRERIRAAHVPRGRRGESLVLATWNIRELGKSPRRADSLRYIAEVLRAFDLTVVVELRENLSDMRAVMAHLGSRYGLLFSDCVRDGGGNRERIGIVFDAEAVEFTGLASHLIAPREKEGAEYLARVSFWRPPYVASFRARGARGALDFILVAAHIRWGDATGPRADEIARLADWATAYARSDHAVDRDVLLVGDFNIPSEESETFRVLRARGFAVPTALAGVTGTDLARVKHHDQILAVPPARGVSFTGRGGALDFYAGGHRALYPAGHVSRTRFTWEMSDHLPLWVEVGGVGVEQLPAVVRSRRGHRAAGVSG